MATTNTDWEGDVNSALHAGAGIVMLSLAQAVLIFTFWITVWPASFGVPEVLHVQAGIAGFFTGAAICGFYLGFRTLSNDAEFRRE